MKRENVLLVLPPEKLRSFKVRFFQKIVKSEGCWKWKAAVSKSGYGTITVGFKSLQAHRLSYVLHIGKIPDGLHVLHECDNPPCCNPKHLFTGTQNDNVRDMVVKGRNKTDHLLRVGESNASSKLREEDIRLMRAFYSKRTRFKLAFIYGMNERGLRKIAQRESWAHVK